MAKTLEDHCVDYLLALTDHSGARQYRRDCLEFWRERYGEKIAEAIKAKVMAKWDKKGGKK